MSIKAPSKRNKAGQSVGAKKALDSTADRGSIKNPKVRVRFDAVIAEGRQLNNAIGTKVDEIEAALRRLRKYRFKQEPGGVRPAESQKPPKRPAKSTPAAPVRVSASIPSLSARAPLRVRRSSQSPPPPPAAQANTLTLTKTRLASPCGGIETNLQDLRGDDAKRDSEREVRDIPAAIATLEPGDMQPKVGIQAPPIEARPPTIPALVDMEENPTDTKSDLLSAAKALLAALEDVNKKLDQAASPAVASLGAHSPGS
jgi:hypothetical protein